MQWISASALKFYIHKNNLQSVNPTIKAYEQKENIGF